MSIFISKNDLSVEEFLKLRVSVDLKPMPQKQIEKALDNSLYTVCARNSAGEAIGMGRLVGDGAYVYYLQNINVNPKYQKCGIGRKIIEELLDYIKEDKVEDSNVMVLLMSSKGSEEFYEKIGFRRRPNELEGCGMIMNL